MAGRALARRRMMQRSLISVCFLSLAAFNLLIAADSPSEGDDSRDTIFYPGDTERVNPLATKLAGNIWLDQKAIWTSPFHMDRNTAKWWIPLTAAVAALVATDHNTITTFENAPAQVRWGNNISRVGAVYTVIPIDAGFYIAGAIIDDPKARETGVLGAEALLDGLIVQEVLKPIAGRSRPNATRDRQEWFEGGASFPSGHAIESWALASVVAHEYSHKKWVPFVAYGLASVVSTARFAAQQHYASDIVAGGAMGWFIGRYVYQTHEDHALHQRHLQPRISPILSPSAGTYGIGVTIPLE
jgi:membrane-associated phospholipid phosphatase